MELEIKQMLIPKENTKTRPGYSMDPEYITIHETDNENMGADDVAHAKLQLSGNSRTASWHYQVDKDSVIQSVPDCEVAWAAGDGGNGTGNRKSIHIEICVNKDGDYKQAVENAADLTKYLMKKHNIPMEKVVQHNKWSGKNCPRHLRAGDWGVKWSDFVDMLEEKKYKVRIDNVQFWQAAALVAEYQKKGYKCHGSNLKVYGPNDKPQSADPYWFTLTDLTAKEAQQLVVELQQRGYARAKGSLM